MCCLLKSLASTEHAEVLLRHYDARPSLPAQAVDGNESVTEVVFERRQ
jgi:hypothetical protein